MHNQATQDLINIEKEALAKYNHRIHVCAGTGCISSNSELLIKTFEDFINQQGLSDTIVVKKVGCMGLCAAGPIVSIMPDNILYKNVTVEDIPEIINALGSEPVKRIQMDVSIPFFTRQKKNALKNSGKINPEKIQDYLLENGYAGLRKAIQIMSPTEVIGEIKKSGLRGRGGAGFSTGAKWGFVAAAQGKEKFVLCNADEGDPGAFMDRSILESDPHAIIEGMTIAAFAVGATQGFVYVRAEYPLAVKRLRIAIGQAKKYGFLGENILDSGLNFDIQIRLGAGAFVCGEETALINSLEGNRGTPKPRPPYPATCGYDKKPTLINNVETYANIPSIILNGGDMFAKTGTESSKGTKVFALTGKIENTGLIEVPMGITLREIVFDIGGGIPNGHKFKAIQTGGPSGGCIPEEFLDTPVDYESLGKLGSIMGSGGMIVIDETSNMIEVAKYFMEFSMEESCGKCAPCRIGCAKIYEILDRFTNNEATEADLTNLENLCSMVIETSLCGLGKSAPNPVVSTLKYFRHEYEEKIKTKVNTPEYAVL